MKKIFLTVVPIIASFIFIVSCEKDKGKAPVAAAPIPVNACDTITYAKHIKPLATKYCISCHVDGGSGGSNLDNYTNLKSRASGGTLKSRVISGTPSFMPPSGSPAPTPAELNLIQCWIDNGAKEK